MSLLRRRMMMQQAEKSGAKYPLVNGTKVFDKAILEITNGNHVNFSITDTNYDAYINISDITENTENIGKSVNVGLGGSLSEKFALKKGDVCELRLKNISRTDGGNGMGTCTFNAYDISGNNLAMRIGDVVSSEERYTSKTMDADRSFGCVFFYIYQPKKGETLEFDVEFCVNGERYV